MQNRSARSPYSGHRMMHPWLGNDTVHALEAEAQRRGLHPDRLAAQLLEHVVRDRLYDAVIDTQ